MRRRILLVSNGSAEQTTGRLMARLAAGLTGQRDVRLITRAFPSGQLARLRHLLAPARRLVSGLIWCDTVAVHTALCLSLPILVAARLMRRRVVVLFWDDYSAGGSLAGRIFGVLETSALKFANVIIVPSGDYLRVRGFKGAAALHVVPFWSSHANAPALPRGGKPGSPITIIFAGQINSLRDFDGATAELAARLRTNVKLHVYSADRPATGPAMAENFRVIWHGAVPQDRLVKLISNLDFGLVSLDREFPGPAFPSKTLAYIAAGLPVIYRGPELAAVTGFLENQRLGLVLRPGVPDDLAPALFELKAGFPDARAAYLRRSAPDWKKIAGLF